MLGITSTSNLSMMRDLLIAERNEATIHRKELRGLHEQVSLCLTRILRFNERTHRKALRRHMSEQRLASDQNEDTQMASRTEELHVRLPAQSANFKSELSAILHQIEGSQLHQKGY